jgi:hypothetical protein
MKATSWAAYFALAGAALLFWRMGGAIVADYTFGTRAGGLGIGWWILAILFLAAAVPGAMMAAVYAGLRQPTGQDLRRLGMAGGFGLFIFLPAAFHWMGLQPAPAPTFPWAVVGYLAYRFVCSPRSRPSDPHPAC